MSKPIHQHEGYMAHMHVKEWDLMKRLSIEDGEIVFNTGALIQTLEDRIKMFEDMFALRPETYKEEMKRLQEEKESQRRHLETL